MVKKTATKKEPKNTEMMPPPSLGEAVIVHTKSSTHWMALVQPKVVTIEEIKFLEGVQVTGKIGHKMERKRTLVPLDHVASIVQFASEDELWSEPQPRNIRPLEEDKAVSPPLTSHEQNNQERHPPNNRNNNRHQRNNRNGGTRKGNDTRGQETYDSRRDKDFNR